MKAAILEGFGGPEGSEGDLRLPAIAPTDLNRVPQPMIAADAGQTAD